ncbi:MAG: hypothetical protein ACRD2G_11620, partial [Terriglobia bacterium]
MRGVFRASHAAAFERWRTGPFEGPTLVKPPALPGDTYSKALRAPWNFMELYRNVYQIQSLYKG